MKINLGRSQFVWGLVASCAVICLAGCGGGTPAPDTADQKAAFKGNPNNPAAIAANKKFLAEDAARRAAQPNPSGPPPGTGAPK